MIEYKDLRTTRVEQMSGSTVQRASPSSHSTGLEQCFLHVQVVVDGVLGLLLAGDDGCELTQIGDLQRLRFQLQGLPAAGSKLEHLDRLDALIRQVPRTE